MKRCLTLLQVICFFGVSVVAQSNFNIAIQKHNNQSSANLLEHQGNLYFTDLEPMGMFTTLNVYSYSASGVHRFTKTINVNGLADVAKILVTNDDKIALFFYGVECHTPQAKYYFLKLDTNGTTLASNTTTTSTLNFKDAVQFSTGNYYAICSNKIYKLNAMGVITGSSTSVFDTLSCLSVQNNSLIACSTSAFYSGVNNFVVNPTSLSIISAYPVNNRYKKVIKNKTKYFGLTMAGTVEVMDTIFQAIANTSLGQNFSAGNQVTDFSISNDTLYVCGTNTNTTGSFILTADSMLNVLAFIPNTSSRSIPVGIASFSMNNYILFNNADAGNSFVYHNFISGYPKKGQYSFGQNIMLLSAAVDTCYIPYATSPYTVYTSRLKIKVKNLGVNPLNSFYLNFTTPNLTGSCAMDLFQQLFSGLNVSPGDSITLTTNDFTMQSNVAMGACALLTAPNNAQDSDMGNNKQCFALTSYINSINEENDLNKVGLTLYPCPAQDVLRVNFSSANFTTVTYKLLNSLGQLVESGNTDVSGNSVNLHIADMPCGMYFLNVKNDSKTWDKKFVIAR